ncbi:hypothetical protein SFUMM280S_11059 [Streptomyces fumanus]
MNWDWSAVSDFMPHFWDGLLVTLRILVSARRSPSCSAWRGRC